MRGKGKKVRGDVHVYGITPAYAGKSVSHIGKKYVTTGSPPPMRGKDCSLNFLKSIARITPAYAGKSFWRTVGYKSIRDHPRLCGEKFRLSQALPL